MTPSNILVVDASMAWIKANVKKNAASITRAFQRDCSSTTLLCFI